jgi:hypothetical protein
MFSFLNKKGTLGVSHVLENTGGVQPPGAYDALGIRPDLDKAETPGRIGTRKDRS